ncbi:MULTISPECIES: purine-nucleoside phosphorylase [unclassified Ruminococcus]|uniref:purine-nucleoside phosphorylase n=1 Tax=unclassified Ruminococcus TaxID=2608920 RepID=UPI00210DD6CA|nr:MULTISPECIES: purine-nucleoside phosphorylase [unclassified Ruminococcus]MCQ4022456.1 purine-nucleoside phosphorylase [Ruminococcus sp. zg-924]MCQ4115720.1 purine-nucleoside phosphorylase [Ruminococcus sp. zg-921]
MNEQVILSKNCKLIAGKMPFAPKTALVLGSGLGGLIKENDIKFSIGYDKLEGMPVSTVDGHNGRFVFARLGGVPVVAMQGRVHLYEGYTAQEVVRPIRLMGMLGANKLILTNAVGGINKAFSCGDLMIITDHISSFVPSPLIGENCDFLGTRFPDMSEVYSKNLRAVALSSAENLGLKLKQGVFVQTTGPNYETPAEIKMYSLLGADAVGMSTAVEAMAAVHMGMSVCGISLITNAAAGISDKPLSHSEVKLEADKAAQKLSNLIIDIISNLGEIYD